MLQTDALDSWVCQGCLADAANVNDTDNDDLDFNFAQESEETDTSNSMNRVCPVYSLKSIPINGEHVCPVCKKAVHAWCSNHENITSSADLINLFVITAFY